MHRHTDIYTDTQMNRHINIQTHIYKHTQTYRHTDTHRDTQTHRHTNTQTHTETLHMHMCTHTLGGLILFAIIGRQRAFSLVWRTDCVDE